MAQKLNPVEGQSPEAFAFAAGVEDGVNGRVANPHGFGVNEGLYEADFLRGRQQLAVAIRSLVHNDPDARAALATYVSEWGAMP